MAIQRYETGVSENNLQNWGEIEAVKEFIQNAMYAKTILKDQISLTWDNGKAMIVNSPSGFTKSSLLIGESEQRKVYNAPGVFGEGFKIAMLILKRLNLDVKIITNGFSVTCALEPSALSPDVNVLVFYITDNEVTKGTIFEVQCSKESFEKAKTYFAVLNEVNASLVATNSVLPDIKNSIFVNGVKITEHNSIFSYNFTDHNLINRDRTTVDMKLVREHVATKLAELTDMVDIKNVLTSILKDDSLLEAQSGIQENSITRLPWKTASKQLFGKCAIAVGGSSDTSALYHGFKLITGIPTQWSYFFKYVLEISPSNHIPQAAIKNVHHKPVGEESSNLSWCKRLIKIYVGDYGKVKVSKEVRDEYGNDCYGSYDKVADITWLRQDILMSKEQCFKTLLHETIHRLTGADDNTPAFTRGWESASYRILLRGKVS